MSEKKHETTTKSADANGGKRVTLQDVARHVGVSVSTASRALSGSSSISVDVRENVRNAARELNYGSGKSHTISVVIDIKALEGGLGEFIQSVQRGIEEESIRLGIRLSFLHIASTSTTVLTQLGETDGILLLSLQNEELIKELSQKEIPAVIVNGRERLMRLESIAPANRTGGLLGTNHLIEMGHRNILFLNHEGRPTIRDRLLGSQRALESAHIDPKKLQMIDLREMRTDIAYDEVSTWLKAGKHRGVTAIQCCNDASAMGAIAALNEAGVSVPREISVLGFDDISAAALISPPLTTIRVDTKDLGARSVRHLIKRIKKPKDPVTYVETAVSLIERGSTAPFTS